MQSAVQIEVYPTDAEAAAAAAALVASQARAAGKRATVAVGAGRSGRPVLVALASCSDLPWSTVEWFLADERCGVGPDGALGSLVGGAAALDASSWVAVVPGDPPRVTVTPALIDRARHVIVTAIGPDTADAVAAALRDGRGPAARVLPSSRVTWVVDRTAAGRLLAEAKPVDDAPGS